MQAPSGTDTLKRKTKKNHSNLCHEFTLGYVSHWQAFLPCCLCYLVLLHTRCSSRSSLWLGILPSLLLEELRWWWMVLDRGEQNMSCPDGLQFLCSMLQEKRRLPRSLFQLNLGALLDQWKQTNKHQCQLISHVTASNMLLSISTYPLYLYSFHVSQNHSFCKILTAVLSHCVGSHYIHLDLLLILSWRRVVMCRGPDKRPARCRIVKNTTLSFSILSLTISYL